MNIVLLTVLAAFALSSCGLVSFSDEDEKPVEEEAQRLKDDELKTDITVSEAENLAKPPFESGPTPEEMLAAPENKVEPITDATPAVAPQEMMGLKTNRLFDQKIRDDDERMERLEHAVQAIRDDFDAVKPTIDRLSTVEADLQGLVSQLNALVGNAPPDDIHYNQLNNDPVAIDRAMGVPQIQAAPAPPVQAAPLPAQDPAPVANAEPLQLAPPPPPPNAPAPAAKPAPVAPQPAPPPAPAIVSGPQLVNIRMADSAGKTRVVMETTGMMNFTSDLDNNEHILTLIFPSGNAKDMGNLALKSTLIKSVSETPQPNGGFILAFTLNKNSSILDQGAIPPGATSPHHRLWIDLSR